MSGFSGIGRAPQYTSFCMSVGHEKPRAVVPPPPECLNATFRGGRGNNPSRRRREGRPAASNISPKNRVDFGCFSRTSVKSASGGNRRQTNALAPEVARHQSVRDRPTFAFDSRRLHHISQSVSISCGGSFFHCNLICTWFDVFTSRPSIETHVFTTEPRVVLLLPVVIPPPPRKSRGQAGPYVPAVLKASRR
jgi:hypothetical protein